MPHPSEASKESEPLAERPPSERDRTDESLRAERISADRVLAEKECLDRISDSLLGEARASADLVLEVARVAADDSLDAAAPADQTAEAVTVERAIEDHILQQERRQADRRLQRERNIYAASLAELLPDERSQTDRYLTEERARSDDELASRDDFLGIVSHDLRNLLGVISLNATLLAARSSTSEPTGRTLKEVQRIQRATSRMERLIGDLVDVVSIDAGKLAVQARPCDASAVLIEAVDIFSSAASEKNITLGIRNCEEAVSGELDVDRLTQVLANLISNALKFTSPGGKVWLDCERAGDELRCSVSDNGKGIAASMLESVFERFWQVGKNDQRGLGLGLYISRCIVEAQGGRIWAESILGQGSSFHFTLPLKARAQQSSAAETCGVPDRGQRRL